MFAMSETVIYLTRHATTIPQPGLKNHEWVLASRGVKQAQELSRYFQREGVTKVYSSPLIRARQTVKQFCMETGIEAQTLPSLGEHELAADYMEPADFQAYMQPFWENVNLMPEQGGETSKQCLDRMMDAILEAGKIHGGKSIWMCSHAQPIALVLRELDETYTLESWANMRMPEIFKLIYTDGRCTWDKTYSSPDV